MIAYTIYIIIKLKRNALEQPTAKTVMNINSQKINSTSQTQNSSNINKIEMEQNDELIAQELQKNAFDIKHVTSGDIKLEGIETKKGVIKSYVQITNDAVMANQIQINERNSTMMTEGSTETFVK